MSRKFASSALFGIAALVAYKGMGQMLVGILAAMAMITFLEALFDKH